MFKDLMRCHGALHGLASVLHGARWRGLECAGGTCASPHPTDGCSTKAVRGNVSGGIASRTTMPSCRLGPPWPDQPDRLSPPMPQRFGKVQPRITATPRGWHTRAQTTSAGAPVLWRGCLWAQVMRAHFNRHGAVHVTVSFNGLCARPGGPPQVASALSAPWCVMRSL